MGARKYSPALNCLTKAVLALLLIFESNAFASLVLIRFDQQRLIVAAESRQSYGPWFDDNVCKVIQVDPRTFFAATGRASFLNLKTKEAIWSAFSIARSAFRESRRLTGYGFIQFIAIWTEMMRERYQQMLLREPEALIGALKDDTISTGIFGHASERGIAVYSVKLRYALPPVVVYPTVTSLMSPLHAGYRYEFGDATALALTNEFFANESDRAKEANKAFLDAVKPFNTDDEEAQRLRRAIEFAVEWIPDKKIIGGPIDTIVVQPGRPIDWKSTPRNCAMPE